MFKGSQEVCRESDSVRNLPSQPKKFYEMNANIPLQPKILNVLDTFRTSSYTLLLKQNICTRLLLWMLFTRLRLRP